MYHWGFRITDYKKELTEVNEKYYIETIAITPANNTLQNYQ